MANKNVGIKNNMLSRFRHRLCKLTDQNNAFPEYVCYQTVIKINWSNTSDIGVVVYISPLKGTSYDVYKQDLS